ncbi:SdpI family protein [Effusibacillus dendaii]|uniref:DUF1648 domain-containing protein n=1 Tax=Effusibacillus dendaii TaxID=2743772 RepID=A0A7I8D7A1_9BACL|nr:SdpI family protein [Effusibacillus dendaii]BCJ86048.1 hypothetical protein skT53_10330 [Effusibacillus dendaii]
MSKLKGIGNNSDLLNLLVGIIPIVIAMIFYDQLPQRMATHFNAAGHPNGYMDKNWFLLTTAVLLLGLPFLMKGFRFADPMRSNYTKFEKGFEGIRLVVTLILSVVMSIVVFVNLGYSVNMQMTVMIAVGLLFLVIGNYLGQMRFTYFTGIRTPWTMANETVWRRTHRMAGPLWMLAGLVFVVCGFLSPQFAVPVFLVTVASVTVVPIVYSYLIYRRLAK